MGISTESRMDQYDIMEQIGRGAFGAAILVHHRQEKKKYVLKKIRLARQTERCRRAAYQEMALIAQVQHPYIVEFKEAWVEKGCYVCIVIGYCEGGDMAELMKKANGLYFPEEKLLKWFTQLLLAVEYLHSSFVLHRDLKCSNIFLTKGQDVRLGDFGLAKTLKEDDLTSSVVGTPNYMCPELLSDIPYGFKSDIWSLGCCMYEMAAHRPAFKAFDMAGLVSKINRSAIGPLPPCYSPSMKTLIKGMLRKNPENRPTASELLKHPYLRSYVDRYRPSCNPPASSPEKPLSVVRNNRKPMVESCSSTSSAGSGKAIEAPPKAPKPISVTPSSRANVEAPDSRKRNHDKHIVKEFVSSTRGASLVVPLSQNNVLRSDHTSEMDGEDNLRLKELLSSQTDNAPFTLPPFSGTKKTLKLENAIHHDSYEVGTEEPVIENVGKLTGIVSAEIDITANHADPCDYVKTKEMDSGNLSNPASPVSALDSSAPAKPNPRVAEERPVKEALDVKSFRQRAEALEGLLELSADLLEHNRLEELAVVLKPFGKGKVSPRETAIWLAKSLKGLMLEDSAHNS